MIRTIGFQTPGIESSTIEECLDYFKDKEEIQVDTETTGFDPYTCKLLLLQLGDTDNQFVIGCKEVDILKFKDLLEDPNKLIIMHNSKFDIKWLLHHGINIKRVYDTFLAEMVLQCGRPQKASKEDAARPLREQRNPALRVSLDKVSLDYLGIVLDKSVRARITEGNYFSRMIVEYSAADVEHLQRIKVRQLRKIEAEELGATLQLENEAVRVFARMEYNGVLIDQMKWLAIADKVENDYLNYRDELEAMMKADPRFEKYTKVLQGDLFKEQPLSRVNWNSPKQKLEILQILDSSIESTKEPKLQKYKTRYPMVKKVIEYAKSKKLGTAFGRAFLENINPVTHRVHTNIWQILTTGRISVSEPNLNQIPAKGELAQEMRKCFIPAPGYKIVGGDFSGMELRIIAAFSKDPLWIKTFKEGGDLHSVLAAMTFEIPIEDVKKPTTFKPDWKYRDVQKTINFGLAYGMSKFKLADTMDINEEKADEIIKKFFKIVPDVEKFLNACGEWGKQKGFIRTFLPYRRKRYFNEWKHKPTKKELGEIERASKNQPIQGSNGDIIKQALVDVQNVIDENNYPVKIIMAVYDEIQTECREDFAEEWKAILEDLMIKAAHIVIKHAVPIEVDCKVSDCWTK